MGKSIRFTALLIVALCVAGALAQQETADDADRLNQQVLELLRQGKAAEAIPIAERALGIRKRVLGENHPDYAQSLNNLAFLYKSIGRYEHAEQLFRQALEIWKKTGGEDYPDYATGLNNLGLLYYDMGRYEHAERLYRQALDIRKKVLGENHLDYAGSLNNLAELYQSMGRYEQAEPLYRQALEIWKKAVGEEHPDYATSLHNLAELYRSMGRYEQAEPLCRKALQIREKVSGKEHPDYAKSLDSLAELYESMGRYEQAEPLLRQALEIRERVLGKEHPDYATGLNNLAGLYYDMGRFAQAELLLRQTLEIDRKALGEQHPGYAMDLNNLALLYKSMGQYEQAEPLYRQALHIREKVLGKEHPGYATSLNNLADLYESMGRYEEAEPLYRQALQIREKVLDNEHPDYAQSLNNLAGLYQSVGRYKQAEPLYRQALEIQKKALGEERPAYAQSLSNLGLLYYDMGRYEQAEPLLRQALEIDRKALGEQHPSYATDMNNLAVLLQATGRPAQALDALNRGMTIEQANLKQVFGFSSEPGMRAYLNPIHGSLDILIALAAQSNSPQALQLALSWALERKGIILDTLARFRQAQNLMERDPGVAAQVAQVRGLKQRLHNLALNPPKGMEVAAQDQERAKLQAELERLQSELSRQLAAQRQESSDNINIAAVQKRLPKGSALIEFVLVQPFNFKVIGKASRWKPARYFAFVIPADPNAVPRLIDLGEGAEIDALVRDVRDNIESFAKINNENRWREEEKSAEQEYRQVSAKLYDALFQRSGLLAALGSAHTLYVSPDGELNRIAFEALVEPLPGSQEQRGGGKYLAENYTFAYIPAGRDLLRAEAQLGQGTVVFAGPDYNLGLKERQSASQVLLAKMQQGAAPVLRGAVSRDIRGMRWDPLPGAAEEAGDVKKALEGTRYGPVQVYPGKDAVQEVFTSLRSPRILHVATHGYFLPNQKLDPEERESLMRGDDSVEFGAARGLARLRGTEDPLLRSGLVFAGANLAGGPESAAAQVGDGWVTAEEVSMMDLRGTELVVLSACNTGLGDVKVGDGVQGLQRAFLLAGARSLIMSLYSVPDKESHEMMRDFYGSLKGGESKTSALHQAQLKMIEQRRKQSGAAHPFFWASFVLLGDPN